MDETFRCLDEECEDDSPPLDAIQIFKRENLISDKNIEFLLEFDAHLETRRNDHRFGRIALANGFAESEDIDSALDYQKKYFDQTGITVTIGDILVDDKIILELKCIETIVNVHRAQVLNYLKATGKQLAIILNFAKEKLEYERFAF